MQPRKPSADPTRPFRLYLIGLGCVLLGAWLMSKTGSLWPLALGSSASVMLTTPLVRHFLAKWRGAAGKPRFDPTH